MTNPTKQRLDYIKKYVKEHNKSVDLSAAELSLPVGVGVDEDEDGNYIDTELYAKVRSLELTYEGELAVNVVFNSEETWFEEDLTDEDIEELIDCLP